jgi:hypothetical protein
MDMTTLGEILRRTGRRIGPVFAGLLTTALLSVATDAVMHACGIFPPVGQVMGDALFVLALAYRIAFAAAGGFVTARAASTRPMGHVAVLGATGLLLGLLGTVATWDAGPEFGPKWYALAVALTAVPATWWGGRLSERA